MTSETGKSLAGLAVRAVAKREQMYRLSIRIKFKSFYDHANLPESLNKETEFTVRNNSQIEVVFINLLEMVTQDDGSWAF